MVIKERRAGLNFKIEKGDVVLGGYKPTAIRRFTAGENIIEGQMVKSYGGVVFVAKSTDNDLERLQGVALQSVDAGDEVEILLYGIVKLPQNLVDGYLFLGVDGFLSNNQSGHYVWVGYKSNNEIVIFQQKEVIYLV